MKSLRGIISDRLRRTMTTEQILHSPRQSESKPMPKSGVQGIPMGGKAGRKAKKK